MRKVRRREFVAAVVSAWLGGEEMKHEATEALTGTSAPKAQWRPAWERHPFPGAEGVRKAMGHTRTMAECINLAEMEPHTELASTTYCLAQPGKDYLVYLPDFLAVTLSCASTSSKGAHTVATK